MLIAKFRDFSVLDGDVFDAVQHERGVLSPVSGPFRWWKTQRCIISAAVTEGDILLDARGSMIEIKSIEDKMKSQRYI